MTKLTYGPARHFRLMPVDSGHGYTFHGPTGYEEITEEGTMAEYGCSDGSCRLRLTPATGQHTNAGCSCMRDIPMPLRLAVIRKLQHLADEAERLRQTANNGAECSKCLTKPAEPVCMYCAECYGAALANEEPDGEA